MLPAGLYPRVILNLHNVAQSAPRPSHRGFLPVVPLWLSDQKGVQDCHRRRATDARTYEVFKQVSALPVRFNSGFLTVSHRGWEDIPDVVRRVYMRF